jgi:ABC-type transport system involved in cytochrome bd biosynthesis fused ATPase/permease subunit
VYLLVVVTFLLAICTVACLVNDLTLVFGIISGVSECLIVFVLPAIFYLKSCKIQSESYQQHKSLSVQKTQTILLAQRLLPSLRKRGVTGDLPDLEQAQDDEKPKFEIK